MAGFENFQIKAQAQQKFDTARWPNIAKQLGRELSQYTQTHRNEPSVEFEVTLRDGRIVQTEGFSSHFDDDIAVSDIVKYRIIKVTPFNP